MVLICLDYLYRDLYGSNIRRIVDHANQLFFADAPDAGRALRASSATPSPSTGPTGTS